MELTCNIGFEYDDALSMHYCYLNNENNDVVATMEVVDNRITVLSTISDYVAVTEVDTINDLFDDIVDEIIDVMFNSVGWDVDRQVIESAVGFADDNLRK